MSLTGNQCACSSVLDEFLARCRAAAVEARVGFLPGRAGIAPDHALEPNPKCRSILDGHAPEVERLSGLHLRARCEFRVPLEFLPEGARLVADGEDREVLLAGQQPGEGESIAASTVLGRAELIGSLLLPDGLEAFAGEHLRTRRGWSELRPRFGCSRPAFELRCGGAGGELWCRFTAEMDA